MMFNGFPILAFTALLSNISGGAAKTTNCSEYEYVVIGSGPGGGTLAANLARAGHSVFLIEAGGDHGDELLQQVPAWWPFTNVASEMTWHFFIERYQNETQARRDNKYTYSLPNGTLYVGLDPPEDASPLGILYPRGTSLGGSSQANAMNFLLPPDNEWRNIAELTGDDSWLPEKMREHFTALERNGYVAPDTPGHGFDGYISTHQNNLTFLMDRPGVKDFAIEAIRKLQGIDVTNDEQLIDIISADGNRDDARRFEEGAFFRIPVHVDQQRKRSGARGYIAETLAARNEDGTKKYPLTLSLNSLAQRILTKKNSTGKPRAHGVEYLRGEGLYSADLRYDGTEQGDVLVVKASREVIVAGGAFNTPQILKLSGIGPRHELERFDIPVVVDLPAVGKHLQDHYESGVSLLAGTDWPNNPFQDCLMGQTTDPNQDPCLAEWVNNHGGPYGEAGTPLSMSYRSSVAESEDVDLYFFGTTGTEFRGFYPGFEQSVAPPSLVGFSVVKTEVRSEIGTVELRSANPRDTPLINFHFFETEGDKDLQALTEGVELVLDILDSIGAPYAPYEAIQPIPGMNVSQSIKDTIFSHHASSSCRMGPKDDTDYCVDSKFRVNGVDALRIVDGSVFPRSPGGFPIAPTFVISQKAFRAIISELE